MEARGGGGVLMDHEGLAAGSIYFVGTATVLLRYAGFTVLTDPNFLHRGDHVHVGYGITSERSADPALDLDALPPVDLCLLSHMHEDHFGRLVQRRLNRDLPIVTTRGAAKALRKLGFRRTHALDTWDHITAEKGGYHLRVTAMPGAHAPGLLSKALPPVMGSLLEFGRADDTPALRLYVSGDTLVHDRPREIPVRYPEIDLALLHLGGTRVFGVVLTMDARQGVEAIRVVRPRTAIPIHYDDYDVFKSPLADFRAAVEEAGLTDRVHYLHRGESYRFEVPATRRPGPANQPTAARERAVGDRGGQNPG